MQSERTTRQQSTPPPARPRSGAQPLPCDRTATARSTLTSSACSSRSTARSPTWCPPPPCLLLPLPMSLLYTPSVAGTWCRPHPWNHVSLSLSPPPLLAVNSGTRACAGHPQQAEHCGDLADPGAPRPPVISFTLHPFYRRSFKRTTHARSLSVISAVEAACQTVRGSVGKQQPPLHPAAPCPRVRGPAPVSPSVNAP